MKKLLCLLLLLPFATLLFGQLSFGDACKINEKWKFQKGDSKEAATPGFDDSKWRTLDLPHDWSVEGALSPGEASATGYLPGGVAWYRKSLDLPADQNGKKIYLYFEGIYRDGEVFVNGTSVGSRPNGYVSYLYEITPYVKFGQANQVAVRVDHSKSADSRWYTGSGIYRDVYLVTANPVHIDPWGISFTTPEVTSKSSTAEIQTSVTNEAGQPATLTIIQQLLDPDNKVVAKSSKKINLPANGKQSISQQLKVNQTQLWSLETPHLYQLKTELRLNGKLTDQNQVAVGFRTLNFDPNKGFSLNGKNMKVKGVCLHHDAGMLGSAVPAEVWERRLTTLKEIGCNAIRTSHNPQAPLLYDLCDRMGFLVLNEAFDEWEFPKKKWVEGWNVGTPVFQGSAEFFEEWGEADLRDMILRDRNHPSVFMWCIGNEVDYPNDPYSHPILDKEGIQQQHTAGFLKDHPHAERLGAIAKRLAAVVKQYDPSRPVTAGLAGPIMSNETDYPGALDVAGYNYTESRYAMDHQKYPQRVLYGSENGHSYDAWKAVRDNEYIFGQFIWTGIDYLGEAHRWPSRGFTSGMIDLAGFKKPYGWFRQSIWTDQPMIYCCTNRNIRNRQVPVYNMLTHWNYTDRDTVQVSCFTNCQQAQLLLNGQKIGEAKNYNQETGIITWELPFRPGKLEVIGLNDGTEAARYAIETSKRPAAIQTRVVNSTIKADKGVAQIEILIVDEEGKPVFLADDEITCTTKGPVRLLGLEASNPTDMGDYTDNRQRVFLGKMIAYIQATGEKGEAHVSFGSPWLKGVEVVLNIN